MLGPSVRAGNLSQRMSLFAKAKDRVVEQLALAYLNNNLLGPYGRATELRIDSTARQISICVELKGETSPVEIVITDYELRSEANRHVAVLKGVRTSRAWLTALAENRLLNVPLKLPPQVAQLLVHAL
jgi:hypothetical protein